MIFEAIDRATVFSLLLVFLMGAILSIVGMSAGVLIFRDLVGLPVGLVLAWIATVFIALVSFFAGGSMVLAFQGARKIEKKDDRELYNVVEEMAIAAGVPTPDCHLIDDPAMNAFATGRSKERAAVAITRGLRERLTRDELQGVIGHEMGHIMNRDILYMMMVGVMAGSIAVVSEFVFRFLWYGGSSGRRSSRRSGGGGGGAILVLILFAFVVMLLGRVLAVILQMAVSREREYLADATSARLTRNPDSLASALSKLGKSNVEYRLANRALAHMCIVNPFRKLGDWRTSLFATHPPLAERIERLREMGGGD